MKKILTNRKGFTLMEIIVVLIIIAVLAAALIPSFVGFIRDSRAASIINEARMGMNAAQVILTEERGRGNTDVNPFSGFVSSAAGTNAIRFRNLIDSDVQNPGGFSGITVTGDRVDGLVYTTAPAAPATAWIITISPAQGAVVTQRGS